MLADSINTLIHMISLMSDMTFLCFLTMLINCKTFCPNLFLKITFYKLKRYFICVLCLFVTSSKPSYSHKIVIRSSSLVMHTCRENLLYFVQELEFIISTWGPLNKIQIDILRKAYLPCQLINHSKHHSLSY